MKDKKLKPSVIKKIMDRAIVINTLSFEMCRDFQIMESDKHPDILILRWLTIDISDIDRPKQCYRYECFLKDGSPQLCSIYYTNQQEANEFLWGLTTLYHQKFAIDHTL